MAQYNREMIDSRRLEFGRRTTIELRAQQVVNAYILRYVYDYAMTGGSGAGAVRSDAHYRIPTFRIKVRKAPVHEYTGTFLRAYLAAFGGGLDALPEQAQPSTVAQGASESEREATWILPMSLLGTNEAGDFALPTPILGTGELTVELADVTEMFTSAIDGTPAGSNGVLETYEEYIQTPDRALAQYQGVRIAQYTRPITQAGAVNIDMLDLEDGDEVRAVFVEALEGGSGGLGFSHSNDLIESLRLNISGETVQESISWDLLRNLNKRAYRLAARFDGVAIIDAAEDGSASASATPDGRVRSDLWPVRGRTKPTLTLEANTPTGEAKAVVTVVFVSRRLAALAAAAAAARAQGARR